MVTVTRSTSARGLLRAAIQTVARYIPDGVKMISIRPGVSFRFWKECDTPRGTNAMRPVDNWNVESPALNR
jgi:hypothetical protein